jgi:hypothetical protein
LMVICLFTVIIAQFQISDDKTSTYRRKLKGACVCEHIHRFHTGRLWLCVNVIVVVSLFAFVVMQSSILDVGSSSWGVITVLGLRFPMSLFASMCLFCSLCVELLAAHSPPTAFAGFGKCALPSRLVALLGISLIAASAYLRWRENHTSPETREKKKNVSASPKLFSALSNM